MGNASWQSNMADVVPDTVGRGCAYVVTMTLGSTDVYSAVQSQIAVTAYFPSKQLLPFVSVEGVLWAYAGYNDGHHCRSSASLPSSFSVTFYKRLYPQNAQLVKHGKNASMVKTQNIISPRSEVLSWDYMLNISHGYILNHPKPVFKSKLSLPFGVFFVSLLWSIMWKKYINIYIMKIHNTWCNIES